jgi:hypothetical protein
MLENPRLAGWRVGRVEGVDTSERYPIVKDRDGLPVRAASLPILDQDTFDRVQEKLRQPDKRGRKTRRGSHAYLLSGLLVCGVCGRKMFGARYRTNSAWRHTYACKAGHTHTLTCSGAALDSVVTDLLLARVRAESFEAQAVVFTGDAELVEVEGEIAELRAAFRDRTTKAKPMTTLALIGDLEERRDLLLAERAAFIKATAGPAVDALDEDVWAASDLDKQRAYVSRLIAGIVVYPADPLTGRLRFNPDRVSIDWREN